MQIGKVLIFFIFLFQLLGCSAEKETVKQQLFPIKDKEEYGYMDINGKLKIYPQFADALPFSDDVDRAPVCVFVDNNKKWGYINSEGNMIINPVFDKAYCFTEGLAPVWIGDAVNGKGGYIDKKGDYKIKPTFSSNSGFTEGLAAVSLESYVDEKGYLRYEKNGYIDKTGEFVIAPTFAQAFTFYEGLALVQVGDRNSGNYGYIDKTGQIVIPPTFIQAYNFSEGLACAEDVNGKNGFIDKTGKFVLELKYSALGTSFHDGKVIAMIKDENLNELWGYVDRIGVFVIPPKFFDARPFSEGMAYVCYSQEERSDGKFSQKWGFIDEAGNLVIDCSEFNPNRKGMITKAEDFDDGLARVEILGSWSLNGVGKTSMSYIDKSGNLLYSPIIRNPDRPWLN